MRAWGLTLLITCLLSGVAHAAPLVYIGYTVTFEKVGFADETLPENQDFILNGISITRAAMRGIFNIAQEESYLDMVSPLGTEWAFPNNNPDVTLSAAECVDGCPEIVFKDWQSANGGAGGGPPATVGQDAIMHLTEQDIYLDIRFTSWGTGSGSGGSFSYERAAISPSADFDRDGDVDGRDFLIWQRNHGLIDALQSEGDADFDGIVTGDDLQVWQESYGDAPVVFVSIPEPTTVFLVGILGFAFSGHRP